MNPADGSGNGQPKIGVYVCHCGTNIAGIVDVEAVRAYAEGLPGVTVARAYKYMCSDPGQELIKEDIRANGLERVVVASCSPTLHEATFRRATAEGGLNSYYFQMVNIREQDSWVHTDKAEATRKAQDLVRAAVHRVRFHKPLERSAGFDQPGRDGGGRRHRRHPRRPDHGQRRQARLPGGARAVDRRAHGPVRQDVPHPRLCRLHPDTQDDRGAVQPQHHPVDNGGGRQGRRLRGQLHGDGAPQAPVHRRGRLRGVPGVHRGVRLCAGQDARRIQPWPEHAQAGLHSLSAGGAAAGGHRPGRLHRVQVRPLQEDVRGGLRRPQRHRLHPDRDVRHRRSRVGDPGHRLQDVRPKADPGIRVRGLPERVHRHGDRAAGELVGAHRGARHPARRADAADRGHPPLHRQPGRQHERVLLPRVLHVLPEAGPPGQGEDRGRDLQLLHRHPGRREGHGGVLQPGCRGGGPLHPGQGGRRVPGGRQDREGRAPGRGHAARPGAQDPGRHGGPGHRPRAPGRCRGRAPHLQHHVCGGWLLHGAPPQARAR